MAKKNQKVKLKQEENTSKLNREIPDVKNYDENFPVVALGASAGGLEAIEEFFTNLDSDTNLAFVIIQHLDPNHKSIMNSIMEKFTQMPVSIIKAGMKIEANNIYLNPPSHNVELIDRKFKLSKIEDPRNSFFPINYFFQSLATDLGEKAIGIILSGTGTDGTIGLKAIKSAGGMVMVQDEQDAQYDGMPRSAISTGLVDFIDTARELPKELVKFCNHPYLYSKPRLIVSENYYQKIFTLIRSKTGHDFSNYKQNTITRRIERRLAVHQINKLNDYINYIKQTPTEIELLFQDLLISVTNFFRDSQSFAVLKEKIIPELIKKIKSNETIRIWVAGCATGEEAYSIAILFAEEMEQRKENFNLQIFATDIDENAIEFARLGVYPETIAKDVSAYRLNKFFVKENNSYKIKKHIRESVVFALHNLIKDPPFSKLHFISCRNLLIYMEQVLQKKIISLFHYTLISEGVLFLGSSESIGEFSDLFNSIDSKSKIFSKKNGKTKDERHLLQVPFYNVNSEYNKNNERVGLREINIKELANKIIIENFSPPSILLNEKFEVLYISGDTEKFLTIPVGEPTFNILKMAKKELVYKLNTALNAALKQNKKIAISNLQIKSKPDYILVDIIIKPISIRTQESRMLLVVFDEKHVEKKLVKKKKSNEIEIEIDNKRISVLEQELQSTKEYLQTTIEELETANEELNSTNEELQSTNEELQSTNEELETSKEEMQSTNEELVTVNSELQNKVDELSRANNDISNLLASTKIGTIFLDSQLCIKRFTPEMSKIFNLIQTDINRPISHITANILYDNLESDANEVLRTLVPITVEIQNKAEQYFSMQISPYRTVENVIDGVVITFVDITERTKADIALRRFITLFLEAEDAIIIHNLKGKITAWNKGAAKMFGYSEEEALKMNITKLAHKKNMEEFLSIFNNSEEEIPSFKTKRIDRDGKMIDVWVNIKRIYDNNGKLIEIVSNLRDITHLKE